MAVNTDPVFVKTPVVGMAVISTANTARDGTGTLGTVVTAGTDGTRIDYVRIVATGTVTAGVVRLFISDGTNNRLLSEDLVTATTPSATVATFAVERVLTRPLLLPSGYSLKASTHNAESFVVMGLGGNLS